ncbi:MAG: NlpC/P60 family protein [Ignavibacteriae bacterium]|nr:MAG: NlpC/P60 family protein [Chlorobiota bacterium]MBL1121767.1 NlpC/P60 family protein [Ignavibacteriota bacterium]MCE7855343.1 NlpC/P60 family protein [Ignavibacteria bacterium CHB3]
MRSVSSNIFLFLISLFIICSCSSSNTIRFGKKTPDEDKEKSSVRFTSEDDSMIVDLNLDFKDPDDLPLEDPDIDVSTLLTGTENDYTFDVPGYDYTTIKEKMLMEIIKYLGTPYKYGGNTKEGMDCSAFTQIIFKNVFNLSLERSARLQYTQGSVIEKGDELKVGDLVFFNTRKRVKPGHVGIYIGDNLFAHASTKKGVTITALDYDYYSRTFMGARRLEMNGLTEKTQ